MRLPILVAMLSAVAACPFAGAHEWYSRLRSPAGVSCCNEQDCRPVTCRLDPKTEREEIKANGMWYAVEHDKVLPLSSPDGGAHACWGNPQGKPTFLCIILPGMAELDPLPSISHPGITAVVHAMKPAAGSGATAVVGTVP